MIIIEDRTPGALGIMREILLSNEVFSIDNNIKLQVAPAIEPIGFCYYP